MEQSNIKTIENYLAPLPDSAVEQVIAFVSYLNYMQKIDSEYPYPDEKRVIEQYRSSPDTSQDWDNIKASI